MLAKMTVANAGSPGRARISRKPLRREGRLSPPVPVVHALAQISFAREPRVQRPPGLPCALCIFKRAKRKQSSGEIRREDANVCFSVVIARSNATKQSRVACVALDCFASLAMTAVLKIEAEHLRNVVPAKAGTQPQAVVTAMIVCHRAPQKETELWVPASAGTTPVACRNALITVSTPHFHGSAAACRLIVARPCYRGLTTWDIPIRKMRRERAAGVGTPGRRAARHRIVMGIC